MRVFFLEKKFQEEWLMKKFALSISQTFLTILVLVVGCRDNGNPVDDGGGIIIPLPIPIAAYDSPVWYPPSGQLIGFNHTPFKSLHYSTGCQYPDQYELESDSTGFWLINSDGTNMHRIFPYTLQTPAWSPDGEWIAFVAGAQILKMRFTGETFDTSTIAQLTMEGRNFFPAWSPDGQWIAYDRSLADSTGPGGIWIMRSDGTEKRALFGGALLAWHPNGNSLIGVIGTSSTSIWTRFVHYDLLQSKVIDTLSAVVGNDNLFPRYSPDGTTIAFASQPLNSQVNLWLMDATGNNLRQLTTEGTSDNSGIPFSWDPTGNFIVFTQYRFDQWPPQNGTLWILNVASGEKRQLTFNPEPSN